MKKQAISCKQTDLEVQQTSNGMQRSAHFLPSCTVDRVSFVEIMVWQLDHNNILLVVQQLA